MKTKLMHILMMALVFALGATVAWSQATAGKVYGKITSGGQPVANAQIILTNEANGHVYKIKTEKDGTFSSVGIMFGNYDQEIESPTGEKLFKRKTSVAGANGAPDDLSVDIGQGGGGAPKVSKEELEKMKADREKAMSENTLISQLNPALQAKNWEAAEPILRQLITMNPNRWEYQQALGNAELNLGKFEEAVATYEKAIPLAENSSKTDPKADPAKTKSAISGMLNNEGSAYTKLKQPQKAVEAYTKAAAMDPNPGTAYFNLCATQYNTGNTQGALAACDKAIAADPTRADAYYIKGSLMMADSKQDKEGKLTAPPGTAEALGKYLELEPEGPHANDVKQMLAYIGAKIETTYGKKKK
jgi:tetratricopeptide (TPR) repeat protein